MERGFSRTARVAENIKRILAPMIDAAMHDIGIGMATVTEVDVSPDFSHARVFISLYCDASRRGAVIGALNARAGRLRHQLAGNVHLKKIPVLKFELDDSIERGVHITELLNDMTDGSRD